MFFWLICCCPSDNVGLWQSLCVDNCFVEIEITVNFHSASFSKQNAKTKCTSTIFSSNKHTTTWLWLNPFYNAVFPELCSLQRGRKCKVIILRTKWPSTTSTEEVLLIHRGNQSACSRAIKIFQEIVLRGLNAIFLFDLFVNHELERIQCTSIIVNFRQGFVDF